MQCNIKLEGDKGADKQDLMRRAIQIVNAKISAAVPADATHLPVVTNASYGELIHENTVNVSFPTCMVSNERR